ncbi:MAG: hypothetical protein RXQ96_07225 [Thermocladium sp.]|jgi:hypothetical protein|nr:MAG: hypothetical protein AT710_08680 [Thermocladium sp. ECH_B]
MQLELPIPHAWVDYGAIMLLLAMVIGFAVEIRRGAIRKYDIYPAIGPITREGTGSAFIKAALEALFLDVLAAAPLSDCHQGAYYERRTRVKRGAHLLIFYGFLFLLAATIIGFATDKWVTSTEFIPAYYLGPWGFTLMAGIGMLGGILCLIGIGIYVPTRYRGDKPATRLTSADWFLAMLTLTVITGFILEAAEILWQQALAVAFWIHMIFVASLFVTMPFTKFSHALYQPIWAIYERMGRRSGKEPRLPIPKARAER